MLRRILARTWWGAVMSGPGSPAAALPRVVSAQPRAHGEAILNATARPARPIGMEKYVTCMLRMGLKSSLVHSGVLILYARPVGPVASPCARTGVGAPEGRCRYCRACDRRRQKSEGHDS